LRTEAKEEVRTTGGRSAAAGFLCLCACFSLLAACQTRAPDGRQFGVTTHAVSGDGLLLTEPDLGLNRGVLLVRGRICKDSGAATPWPQGISLTGYDASHRPTFQRLIPLDPRATSSKGCRAYATALRGVRMPAEIEARAVSGAAGGL
jgi:hypothetical protein